jgi:hypothetical protein
VSTTIPLPTLACDNPVTLKKRESDIMNALVDHLNDLLGEAKKRTHVYRFSTSDRKGFGLFVVDSKGELKRIDPPFNPRDLDYDSIPEDAHDRKAEVQALMDDDRAYAAALMGFDQRIGGWPWPENTMSGEGLEVLKHLCFLCGWDGEDTSSIGVVSFPVH